MKKAFPIALAILGLMFLVGGGFAVQQGFDARNQVKAELLSQNITTPADASIPNAVVKDAATARSMAAIIDKHALASSGGKTYSELGRFVAAAGGDTNDEAAALKGADGRPVANPIRNVAFQASALRTSLLTSVMAFEISKLVIGLGVLVLALGLAVGGVGVALAGLAIPAVSRRLHVEPVAA